MLVNLNDVLKRAQKERYAVGLFNTHDTDMLEAVISAAEEARSPVVIGTAEVLLPYGDLPLISPSLVAAARRASVPVVVHFDHGLSFERTMEAVKLGFSSIMFDASLKPYADNVAETREIVKIAHSLGISVEGEIGHVGQASSGDEGAQEMYTTVEEAVGFINDTGVDALAISVGTAHGVYKAKPKLNLERLGEIRSATETPLVLHGGSGLSDDDFRNAILGGIAKLNIHTDLCLAGMAAMRAECARLDPARPVTGDYLQTHTAKVAAIKACVLEKLRLFGSVGKA